MAKFYLQNAAAGYTPATKRGAWDASGSTTTGKLGTAPAGSQTTIGVAESSNTSGYDVLLGRWISDPLPAQTFSATTGYWTSIIGFVTSSASSGAVQHIHIFFTQGDSDLVRGSALVVDDVATGDAIPTSAAGQLFANSLQNPFTNSVTISANDRMVVEIGYQDTDTSTASYTTTMNYGNTGADLTDGDTAVTTHAGWIQFFDVTSQANSVKANICDVPPSVVLNTPTADQIVGATPTTLNFTGTDSDGNPIRYHLQVMQLYRFDSSDAAWINNNNAWGGNIENIFDDDETTYAYCYPSGSTSSNFLHGQGTDAPTSGGTITKVYVRARTAGHINVPAGRCDIAFYTDNLGETLGTLLGTETGSASWTDFMELTAPTGGWTWQKVNDLEFKAYVGESASWGVGLYKVEVGVVITDAVSNTDTKFTGFPDNTDPFASAQPVDYVFDPTLPTGAYAWSVQGIDPSGATNSYGAWTTTQRFYVPPLTTNKRNYVTANIYKIRFVRKADGSNGSATGTTSIATSSFVNDAGNLLFVIVRAATNDAVFTISDTENNDYTQIGTKISNGGLGDTAIWYAKNIKASTGNVVTVNFGGSYGWSSVIAVEYAGLDTVSPLDVATTPVNTTAGNSGETSPSFTTAQADEVIIGAAGYDNGSASAGAIGGTTATIRSDMGALSVVEDRIVTATQSNITAAIGSNGSGDWTFYTVSFKAGTGISSTTANTSAKANIRAVITKDNSTKASIKTTGQQAVYAKADIRVNDNLQRNSVKVDIRVNDNTVINRVKADIKVTDNTANNFVKADIRTTYTNNNSAKAWLVGIVTQANSVKTNLKTQTLKDNSAKANIRNAGQQPVSVKANIRVNNTTQNNSAKADIKVSNNTANNSTKANIQTTSQQNNSAKADVRVNDNTVNNSAKAWLTLLNRTANNNAKANILASLTQNNSGKSNILRTVSSHSGPAIGLKGTAITDRITIDDNVDGSMDQTTAMTVSLWVRTTTNTAPSSYFPVVAKSQYQADGWDVILNNQDATGMKLYFRLNYNDGTGKYTAVSVAPANKQDYTDTMHLIGVTFDNGTAKLFVDGNKKYEGAMAVSSITTNNRQISIGYEGARELLGVVDDFRLYNRVLSEAEMAQLARREDVSTSELKVWLKMDEGTGVTASDASGLNNNGTLLAGTEWTAYGAPSAQLVKSNIVAPVPQANRVTANLLVVNNTANTSAKASVVTTNPFATSVRANLKLTTTKDISVKASIKTSGQIPQNATVNIKVVDNTKNTSTKANITWLDNTDDASVKTNILVAPSPRKFNFLKNPSFEIDDFGQYWTIGSIGAGSTEQALFGSKSAKIVWSGADNFRAQIIYGLTIGQTYTFSLYCYISSYTSGTIKIAHDAATWGNYVSDSFDTGVIGAWQRKSITFTATASSRMVRFGSDTTTTATAYFDGAMLEEGTTASTYFDGSTTGGTWVGTAHASGSYLFGATSSVKANIQVTATDNNSVLANILVLNAPRNLVNLIPNPSFETTAGWLRTGGDYTVYNSSDQQVFGSYSGIVTTGTVWGQYGEYMRFIIDGVTPGQTYTYSAYAYVTSASQYNSRIEVMTSDWGNRVTTDGTVKGAWQRLTVTYTVPAGFTQIFVTLENTGGQPATGTIYWDGVQLETGTVVHDYFDGSFPQAAWAGVANNSQSYLSGAYSYVKTNIVAPVTQNNSAKSSIQAQVSANNFTKADLLVTTVQSNNVKASIQEITVGQSNSVKASIVVVNTNSNNVKVNIRAITTQNNFVKVDIKATLTQDNRAKANVLVKNTLANNSAKADLKVQNTQNNSVKADIKVTTTQNNFAKADIRVNNNTANNSAKSWIMVVNTDNNAVKADIKTQTTKDTSVKAAIQTAGQVPVNVKANILRTGEKQGTSVKANITWLNNTDNNSVKANIQVTTLADINSKADIIVANNISTNSVTANIDNVILRYFFTASAAPTTADSGLTGSTIASSGALNLFNISTLGYTSDPELQVCPPSGASSLSAAVSMNSYFTFTITPKNGKKINYSTLTFNVARGGASTPRGFSVRSSLDNYTSDIITQDVVKVRPGWASVVALLQNSTNQTTAITFRFYVYAPNNGTSLEFDNITFTGEVVDSLDNAVSANILAVSVYDVNSKANILATGTQDNSAKGSLQNAGQQVNSVKADIRAAGQQATSAKANIKQGNVTQNNSAKASLVLTQITDNTAKANLQTTYTQDNAVYANFSTGGVYNTSTKANLCVTNTSANSTRADILVENVSIQSAIASIVVTASTAQNAKANLLATQTQANSVKARLMDTFFAQTVKANIRATTTQSATVKAQIVWKMSHENYVTANLYSPIVYKHKKPVGRNKLDIYNPADFVYRRRKGPYSDII